MELSPGLEGTPSRCSLTFLYKDLASESCFYDHKKTFKGNKGYWNKCSLVALAFAVLGSLTVSCFPGEVGFLDCRMGPIMDQIDDRHSKVPIILGE